MIEGILTDEKTGRKYKVYKSPNITKKHNDFEILVNKEYIVWEETSEEKVDN